ncbi:hypothetical protein BJY24_001193 [Nocardia transvalensis]|uniref:Uncharacterized protein n=1 Tax=Nocardia transvalensis TaxID=37333 RepID=A0A7W9PA54_9NOCA|nr:hypothetical protein [Nocardia transvalensis]
MLISLDLTMFDAPAGALGTRLRHRRLGRENYMRSNKKGSSWVAYQAN